MYLCRQVEQGIMERQNNISAEANAYMDSRREYWRKELANDRKSNKTQVPSVNTTVPVAKPPANGLTGEAYLNSRREYWRNEMAKDPDSYRNSNSNNLSNSQKTKNTIEESSVLPIISGLIGAGIFIAIIASGGEPLLVLCGLYVGALLLKCMR